MVRMQVRISPVPILYPPMTQYISYNHLIVRIVTTGIIFYWLRTMELRILYEVSKVTHKKLRKKVTHFILAVTQLRSYGFGGQPN